MKFYIASHSGIATDDMSYKEFGGQEDLNSLFPELIQAIHRHASFNSVDIRLTNGDRLRIYDINKTGRLNAWNTDVKLHPQIMEEKTDEKRAFINS